MTGKPFPAVSVLVLAYNHGRFIAECLDGILGQDYRGDIEVLVGEDHSTDDTLAIVREYEARHPGVVHVVTSSGNVGMHANHRRLLQAASGDLVAYCEGDDFWQAADKLTVQVDHLMRHEHQVGVHSDVDHLVSSGEGRAYVLPAYWARHVDRPRETTFDDLLVRNIVQTCSVVLRADVAKSYPDSAFAQGHYVVEDWPLFLHATSFGPLGLLDRSLATYRRVPGSVTQQGVVAKERQAVDQLRLVQDAVALRGLPPSRCRAGAEVTRDALIWNAIQSGDGAMLARALDAAGAYGVPPHRLDPWLRRLARWPTGMSAVRALAVVAYEARQRLRYRQAD